MVATRDFSQPELGQPLAGPVSAEAIESALTAAWTEANASADPTHPAVRASVLTLVVGVASPQIASGALDVVARLAQVHPARTVILLPGNGADGAELQAWYSTGCGATEETDLVLCGEQIVLAANASGSHHLPTLTEQLLLTDLPSFFWWVGDLAPSTELLFERLTELADRVIVDSSLFQGLGAAMARLHWLTGRRHQPCAVSDLSWAALTPWRELLAQFFDSPTLRPYQARLDRLTIAYAPSGAEGPAQAALLLGWLVGCLGWQAETPLVNLGGQITEQLKRADGQRVQISLGPVEGDGVAGLRRVTLAAGEAASIVVAREPDGVHALTEADVTGIPTLRRIVRFETPAPTKLLTDELMLFRRDRVYEDALAKVVALTGNTA